MSRSSWRPTPTGVPIRPSPASASPSARPGHRGSSFDSTLQRGARAGDHAGDLPLPRARQGIDGPLFLGIDTHALSRAGLRQRARGAGGQRRRGDDLAGRRVHADAGGLARHPGPQPRPREHGLADGIVITPSHNPPDRRRLQVQPAQRRPGRHRRHRLDREPGPTRLLEGGLRDVQAHAVRAGAARGDARTSTTTSDAYVADLGNVIDMDAIRAAGVRMGVDPLGGAGVHYWARDRRALRPRPRPWSATRSIRRFRFMTLDWDGQHPHGSVVAVRDAAADRPQGPLRHRLRLRHRPRPPRHRDAAAPACCRPTTTWRSRSTTCSANRPQLGRGCRGRQDGGQQPHDRPRGGAARPPALRGAGRLQVVRRRPARRRRWASAARRAPARPSCAATARCGRPTRTASSPALLAGGDHRAHRPRSRRALSRADARARRPGRRPHRRAGHARAEAAAGEAVAGSRCTIDRAGRRADRAAC